METDPIIQRMMTDAGFAQEVGAARGAAARRQVLESAGFSISKESLYVACANLTQDEADLIAKNLYDASPGRMDKVEIWNEISLLGDLFS